MDRVKIEIIRLPGSEGLPLPRYMSDGAAGMDLPAAVTEPLTIDPGAVKLVPTGFAVAVPEGLEAQVRSRSGLALKHGVFVLNSPGTIDSDYRGEIGVILANAGGEAFTVKRGDRIAQLVVARVASVSWVEGEALATTGRDAGGFGHTGGHGASGS
jgi:dUTP pyrophosphatase